MEGDIVVTNKLKKYFAKKKLSPSSPDSPFDALTHGHWPDRVVPYKFNEKFSKFYRFLVIKSFWSDVETVRVKLS